MALELPLGLPRSVVLKNKNNGKYLRYTNEDTEQHGLLQFTGEATIPTARFAIEPSTTNPAGLVHIRCASNNKYCLRSSQESLWIAAAADGIEEDQSKWSCTLFKPVLAADVDGGDALFIRFLHVQSNHYACLMSSGDSYANFLYAGWAEPNKDLLMDVCQVVDSESLLVLPRYVALKADNGKYLSADRTPLPFSGTDIGDPSVGFQVFPTPDGAVQIREKYSGHDYFVGFTNSVSPGSSMLTPADYDPSTVLWPVKVEDNIIALRCQGNNKFLRRDEVNGFADSLSATVSTISQESKIRVEEHVISREIYNVVFRLLDARIYDETVVVATKTSASNDTPNTVTHTVTLTHTETTASTWEASLGLNLGFNVSITAGIPFIEEAKVEISGEISGSYTWGKTNTTEDTLTNQYDAVVSPHSVAYVSLLATKGKCDVPFSYSVTDVGYDGKKTNYDRDDGIYTGMNSYNYQYQVTEKPLNPKIN
ncbi:unnamed protein product [Linum trigynum]|uniref:Agglutinin domain-containing protein n=1 Tax=Linum trigynum TaxID=586398 RepID=A0AAV2FJ94_9ROSI